MYGCTSTEVQRVDFVSYTGGEGGSSGLWNLQNLRAVPPYCTCLTEENMKGGFYAVYRNVTTATLGLDKAHATHFFIVLSYSVS